MASLSSAASIGQRQRQGRDGKRAECVSQHRGRQEMSRVDAAERQPNSKGNARARLALGSCVRTQEGVKERTTQRPSVILPHSASPSSSVSPPFQLHCPPTSLPPEPPPPQPGLQGRPKDRAGGRGRSRCSWWSVSPEVDNVEEVKWMGGRGYDVRERRPESTLHRSHPILKAPW